MNLPFEVWQEIFLYLLPGFPGFIRCCKKWLGESDQLMRRYARKHLDGAIGQGYQRFLEEKEASFLPYFRQLRPFEHQWTALQKLATLVPRVPLLQDVFIVDLVTTATFTGFWTWELYAYRLQVPDEEEIGPWTRYEDYQFDDGFVPERVDIATCHICQSDEVWTSISSYRSPIHCLRQRQVIYWCCGAEKLLEYFTTHNKLKRAMFSLFT
jgi:hypothetical protein